MTRSTTTKSDSLELALNQAARAAAACKIRITIGIREGGIVFEAVKRPFLLQHFLTFEQLRLAPFLIENILNNMEKEIQQAIADNNGFLSL